MLGTQHLARSSFARCSRLRSQWRFHTHNLRARAASPQASDAAPQASSQERSTILLSGFSPAEVRHLSEHSDSLFPATPVQLLPLSRQLLQVRVSELPTWLPQEQAIHLNDTSITGGPSSLGRLMFFSGPAQQHAGFINEALLDMGMLPSVVAAQQPRHADMSVAQALQAVQAAHEQYYHLVQPLVHPQQQQQQVVEGVKGGEEGDLWAGVNPQLAMNLVVDQGRVTNSYSGELREDASHLVVLDGLLTPSETQQLLDFLTTPGHDHSGPPPTTSWAQSCVDRPGDQPTWGLQQQVVEALRQYPPAALTRLGRRLGALYPEWTICLMPSGAMEEDGEAEEEEGEVLSPFVGNAVLYGDPCCWHVDADPSGLSPCAPWVQRYGQYINREPGRPLFVSLMVYLNPAWEEDWFAETLFLDPESGTGAFVQPRPGRVVLMDQDMPHRISAPSPTAPGPRYSFVLKLVFIPKTHEQQQRQGGEVSLLSSVGDAGAGGEEEQQGDDKVTSASLADGGAAARTLSRPEWGPPQRLGSAWLGFRAAARR